MSKTRASSVTDALRAAGLKATPQRLAVAECLMRDHNHPTALDLHARLRLRFPSMSVATVYNTLRALESVSQCRQLEMGGSSRFDPTVEPHDHAVCELCGAIRDVGLAGSQRGESSCSLPGFRVARVERIYRGVCAKCANAA
ncbi:MAG: Fur family transcriptional regulator [Polyangiales bacterium]